MNEFDIKALTWDDNPLFIERSKHIADKIREHVSLNKEMEGFEYGCGTGLISFNLMPYLKTITLADSSDGMLEVLKQKIQKNKITSMDILKTDFMVDAVPERKFDILYTALTLHHIVNVEAILAKFYTMLKKSAFLCIADLDTEDGSFHGPEFKGHLGFDRNEMKNLFELAGFKNIKVVTCYEIKRVTEQNKNDSFPVFLMTGEKF
jgi:ubiquinone/menaquinone biosynthesis C-methylase UbiE